MVKIIEFITTQCDVIVYDSGQMLMGKTVMVVESHHRTNGKTNVRFGTKQQVYNLLLTYQYSVIGGKKEYEQYLSQLSVEKIAG